MLNVRARYWPLAWGLTAETRCSRWRQGPAAEGVWQVDQATVHEIAFIDHRRPLLRTDRDTEHPCQDALLYHGYPLPLVNPRSPQDDRSIPDFFVGQANYTCYLPISLLEPMSVKRDPMSLYSKKWFAVQGSPLCRTGRKRKGSCARTSARREGGDERSDPLMALPAAPGHRHSRSRFRAPHRRVPATRQPGAGTYRLLAIAPAHTEGSRSFR